MNKKTLSIAAAILSIAGSTGAFAAELPNYEANGFAVSPMRQWRPFAIGVTAIHAT